MLGIVKWLQQNVLRVKTCVNWPPFQKYESLFKNINKVHELLMDVFDLKEIELNGNIWSSCKRLKESNVTFCAGWYTCELIEFEA